MPKKKKSKPNGFYVFLNEIRNEERKNGNDCSIAEAALIAGPLWEQMSLDERKPYLEKVRTAQANASATKKFTSLGMDINYIKSEARAKEEFFNIMNLTIKELMKLDNKSLIKKKLFFCHVNFHYWTDKLEDFRPAEFALTVFSFEHGLIDSLHFFIKKDLPLGFKYEANEWSSRTHQIPVNNSSCGDCETSYSNMHRRVFEFIRKHSPSEIPPIYTMFDVRNTNYSHLAVNNTFAYMCDAACADSSILKVYDITILFYELRNRCSRPNSPTNVSVAILKSEIEKDPFSYAKNIACNFHEKNDCSVHCSLSMTRRWVFLFCDHLCFPLHVDLVLGFHIPIGTAVNYRGMSEDSPPPEQKTLPVSKSIFIQSEEVEENNTEQRFPQAGESATATRLPISSYKKSTSEGVNPASTSSVRTTGYEGNSKGEEWTVVSGRGFGRGRGVMLSQDHENVRWPVSGRGQRLK